MISCRELNQLRDKVTVEFCQNNGFDHLKGIVLPDLLKEPYAKSGIRSLSSGTFYCLAIKLPDANYTASDFLRDLRPYIEILKQLKISMVKFSGSNSDFLQMKTALLIYNMPTSQPNNVFNLLHDAISSEILKRAQSFYQNNLTLFNTADELKEIPQIEIERKEFEVLYPKLNVICEIDSKLSQFFDDNKIQHQGPR